MPIFYDTHAHLDDPGFNSDLPQVVERAQAAGISKIICIGTDFTTSERAIALSEQFPNVFAAVGWHPSQAVEAPAELRPALRQLAQHPKVLAIGETGMDYYWLPSKKQGGTPEQDELLKRRQAEIFDQQLEIAAELGLNVVVHQREALEDTLHHLQKFAGRVRGVFHCFANDAATVQRVLAMGSIVSFTGILTFKNGQNVRDALAATPLGKFMLETDCPYMTPEPHRGKVKRSEPMHVADTARVAAQVKGCTLDELSAATCATAHQFFPKLPASS
ncbi:MAG TPA: TatD family hydrolase [Candidatus Sulfotelmatobacter sp.]|nr:TatD family hydrolase [Candidatus Sulfotelmatobacter sp.]